MTTIEDEPVASDASLVATSGTQKNISLDVYPPTRAQSLGYFKEFIAGLVKSQDDLVDTGLTNILQPDQPIPITCAGLLHACSDIAYAKTVEFGENQSFSEGDREQIVEGMRHLFDIIRYSAERRMPWKRQVRIFVTPGGQREYKDKSRIRQNGEEAETYFMPEKSALSIQWHQRMPWTYRSAAEPLTTISSVIQFRTHWLSSVEKVVSTGFAVTEMQWIRSSDNPERLIFNRLGEHRMLLNTDSSNRQFYNIDVAKGSPDACDAAIAQIVHALDLNRLLVAV